MSELVLDASVLVKWFKSAGEEHLEAAQELSDRFSQGELVVVVPPLAFLELLNVAARRWRWQRQQLERLAVDLDLLGLNVRQPSLGRIAHWCAAGLTAYDAAYVALAEETGSNLITDDDRIVAVAAEIARRLGS